MLCMPVKEMFILDVCACKRVSLYRCMCVREKKGDIRTKSEGKTEGRIEIVRELETEKERKNKYSIKLVKGQEIYPRQRDRGRRARERMQVRNEECEDKP